jgi:hypothetical protein
LPNHVRCPGPVQFTTIVRWVAVRIAVCLKTPVRAFCSVRLTTALRRVALGPAVPAVFVTADGTICPPCPVFCAAILRGFALMNPRIQVRGTGT